MDFVICKCFNTNFLYKKIEGNSYKLLHSTPREDLFESFNNTEFINCDDINIRLLKNHVAENFVANQNWELK